MTIDEICVGLKTTRGFVRPRAEAMIEYQREKLIVVALSTSERPSRARDRSNPTLGAGVRRHQPQRKRKERHAGYLNLAKINNSELESLKTYRESKMTSRGSLPSGRTRQSLLPSPLRYQLIVVNSSDHGAERTREGLFRWLMVKWCVPLKYTAK